MRMLGTFTPVISGSGGVKVLDLRDKVLLNAGASFALNKYIELLAEVASTVYVGGGTPSLERFNPVDLNLGDALLS